MKYWWTSTFFLWSSIDYLDLPSFLLSRPENIGKDHITANNPKELYTFLPLLDPSASTTFYQNWFYNSKYTLIRKVSLLLQGIYSLWTCAQWKFWGTWGEPYDRWKTSMKTEYFKSVNLSKPPCHKKASMHLRSSFETWQF